MAFVNAAMAQRPLGTFVSRRTDNHHPDYKHCKLQNKLGVSLRKEVAEYRRTVMAFVTAAMAQPPPAAPVFRRSGNHHPNLWNDCFIQSLSSPYSASSYHERRETLSKEIKAMLNELGRAEPNPTANNLLERFWTVDTVQRLGIGRKFQKETKLLLDYSYKYWKEEGITLDLNTTALGFLTLRLNGYHVSPDVFNIFKEEDGQFFCPVATKETELRSMLSLHRASQLVFPGESINKEANIFTTKYLQHALNEWKESGLEYKNQLIMEVEYALKYPWICSAPTWEARNYIEIFREGNTSNMEKGGFNQKLLELAILDFNILQSLNQSELKQLSRWWEDSGASQLDFFRHRHVEFYFWYAFALSEEAFSASRIGFAKLCTIYTLLDDIYDTYGTLDELKPFTTALISRQMSTTHNLPHYMKVSFTFMMETMEEVEKEIEKMYGHHLHVKKYTQVCWENYVLSHLKEAEWIASNYLPRFEEYLKNSYTSAGVPSLSTYAFLLMDTIHPDKILKELDFPSLKFQVLPSLIGRFIDDIIDFEDEKKHGKSCSSVACFMRNNLESTYEDARNYVNKRLECYMEDLTNEFLTSYDILACIKNFYFNVIVRGFYFFYNEKDGFNFVDKDIKNAINKILVEPIELYVVAC